MHSKISPQTQPSNQKDNSKGKQHHHRSNKKSTNDDISLLERQIELRRRLSRILNFNELYSDTPCVRVGNIPNELDSLTSQDSASEKSFEVKEVTDAIKDNKSMKSCNVSSNEKVNKTTSSHPHYDPNEDRKAKPMTPSKCNQFILFRQRIIMP